MSSQVCIRIHDLKVSYTDQTALSISQGSVSGNVIALVGHNGAGKSTLMKIDHLTLNTGHLSTFETGEISPPTIDILTPLLHARGGPIPAFPGYHVRITTAPGAITFDITGPAGPMVLCATAWTPAGATHTWPILERIYIDLSDTIATLGAPDSILQCPHIPATTPWLATIILPAFLTHPHPDTITWIPDFTQCLAATTAIAPVS